MKRPRHILYFLAFGFCAGMPVAGAMPGSDEIKRITEKWQCKWCPVQTSTKQGYVEGGAGFVSNDSFKHGNYTGLDEQGLFFIGNAGLNYRGTQYMDLEASDLGLDSRRITLDGGRQGHYDISLLYDELPRLQYDTAGTPFTGTDNQTLPGGWVYGTDTSGFTALNSTLHDIDIYTQRKKIAISASYQHTPLLSYELGFQRETKKGNQTIGVAIGSNPGNARAVILAAPVDYRTGHVTASVNYSGRKITGSLDYEISSFRNQTQSVTWDNPFTMTLASTKGQTSLMPDNTLHQVSLSGNYKVSAATTGTAVIALGLARQDEAFLPFTTNSGITASSLPRNSLDGEIKIFRSNFNVTHQLNPATQLRIRYNQQEQENNTQRASYAWVVADYINSTDTARSNIAYGFRKRQLGIDGRFLASSDNTLTGAVKQERFDRTYQDRDRTDQTAFWLKLKNTSHRDVSFTVKTGRENRDGSAWTPVAEIQPPENILMRKYYLADRKRDNTRLQATWTPSGKLTSGLAIDYAKDGYDRSEVGLQESSEAGLTVDASYAISQTITLSGSYSNTRIQSTQAGSDTASTADWSAENDERVDTLIIGVRHSAFMNKLDLGIDYSFSDARADTSVTGGSPFPELESTRHTINISGKYKFREQLTVTTQLIYEKYDETDWQTDSVTPNTLTRVLTTGRQSPSYDTGVINISVRRDF